MIEHRRSWWKALAVVVPLAVFGWFAAGIDRVPFHPDETSWIYMSDDLEAIVSLDWSRLVWHRDQELDADRGYRLLNPPLAKYVIGIGRRIDGEHTRITDWNWRATPEENAAAGAAPSPAQLHLTRLASAAAAALSIGVFVAVVRRTSGWLAVVVAALLLVSHPLELLHARRAMAEGTGQLFQLVAVLAIIVVATGRERRVLQTFAMAVSIGFAVAAKHHFVALGPIALAVAGVRWWPAASRGRAIGASVAAAIISLAIMLATFVLLNPVMYAQPIRAARLMATMRVQLTEAQAALEPGAASRLATVPGRVAAAVSAITWETAEPSEWRTPPRPTNRSWPSRMARVLFAVWIVVGLAVSVRRARREWQDRTCGPSSIVLLWLAAHLTFCALFVSLDWQRHFLPLLPPACLLAGDAVALVVRGRVS